MGFLGASERPLDLAELAKRGVCFDANVNLPGLLLARLCAG